MTLQDYNAIRGRPRVPPDEVERRKTEALEMLRAGVARAQVAARTRLDPYAVAAIAKANGISRKRPGKPEAPERADRRAKALALLRAGMSRDAVRTAAQLHSSEVAAIAREYGIPRLPSGPRNADSRWNITRLTDAELDVLEASVAAKRAYGA